MFYIESVLKLPVERPVMKENMVRALPGAPQLHGCPSPPVLPLLSWASVLFACSRALVTLPDVPLVVHHAAHNAACEPLHSQQLPEPGVQRLYHGLRSYEQHYILALHLTALLHALPSSLLQTQLHIDWCHSTALL